VKIKITEYFPGAGRQMGEELSGGGIETTANHNLLPADLSGGMIPQHGPGRVFGMLGSNDGGPVGVPGSDGRRYYTIQRVNGNGGNGKFDGTAGPHKHSLEESDRVKKNSVLRRLLMEEKANKKSQVSKSPPSEIGAAGASKRDFNARYENASSLHYCIIAPSHHLPACACCPSVRHPLPVVCFCTQREKFLQPDSLYTPLIAFELVHNV
jgi:hypothetical protein